MNKRMRQYIGLIVAIILYYVVHEGTHFLYALFIGAFKNVNIMGLGVQIDIYVEKMTQTQLGVFCLLGSIATIIIAYVLVVLIDKIGKLSSSVLKTCAYYTTIAMLCIDPLYLSLLCGFFWWWRYEWNCFINARINSSNNICCYFCNQCNRIC